MDSFWGNIFKRKDRPTTIRDLLKAIPLFAKLSRSELEILETILHERNYQAKERIFRQGDPGVGMYIISSGSVVISDENSGEILAELHKGDFFGDIALLNEIPRSATAKATTTTTLFGLFHPDFLDLVAREPRLGSKVLLALAEAAGQRLIRSNEEVVALRRQLTACREHAQHTRSSDRQHEPSDAIHHPAVA